ncbi:hypothetical protein MGU_10353 [Metarhizium guizhouense ARSEF 977]|uniref:Uncharacterized protein n=1 Tax=Metarhizium guizhouense (strain ARSEF 977) TaxID=1276136 RepID=A0A0B4GII7_METGA|nr:hypothetical protein MGU_10353 [Metarhizium guizhouense ARSEF 977]
MVRLSSLLSLALAAKALYAAPSVPSGQDDLQTGDILAGEQAPDILPRQAGRGGAAAARGGGAIGGNVRPSPERELNFQNQRTGSRGSTKFKDTKEGRPFFNTKRPGGKVKASNEA